MILNSIFKDTLKKLYFTQLLDNALAYLTGVQNGYTFSKHFFFLILKLKSRFPVLKFISIKLHRYWLIMKLSVEQAFVKKIALQSRAIAVLVMVEWRPDVLSVPGNSLEHSPVM